MAVPKRKQSRANTHARRSQWKADAPPTLVKTVENGKVTYSLPPHRAKVVEDSAGTPPLFLEYKGRKVADV